MSMATRRASTAKGRPARAPIRRTAVSPKTTRQTARAGGGMTVREAGRMGGLKGGKKGGETVKAERGIEFYQEIGRKGGQKVRQLIEEGRAALKRKQKRAHT